MKESREGLGPGVGHDHVRVSSWWRSLLACDVRARVESAVSPTPLLLQDLEKYVGEKRKKDAERVMRGMQGGEWKGLEAGLAEMGIGMFSILTAKEYS